MKHRKNLGLRIKDRKERGIWAELYFMALAAGYGLKILSPYPASAGEMHHLQSRSGRLPHKRQGAETRSQTAGV